MIEKQTRPRILAIDDTQTITDTLVLLLRPTFDISTAADGLSAITMLDQADAIPDLILLDMVMVGMDGIQVCEHLRSNEKTREIPIIFLTGMVHEERITAGFAAGAVDYVRKPFNKQELLARIHTHIRLRQSITTLSGMAQKLGKYLPPGLYESIFSGQNDVTIASRRKPLTICFTDIVGFTSTSEKMANRELTEWLNRYLNAMVEIALRYGAVLDKFIGDGILLFFGDAQSGDLKSETVNCIKMVREMIGAASGMDMKIRAGINTGDCHVGNFGSENHMEYGVIGKEVNIAARLEANSEPNRILVSESTANLVRGEFLVQERGEINLKGIDQPVRTFWIDA